MWKTVTDSSTNKKTTIVTAKTANEVKKSLESATLIYYNDKLIHSNIIKDYQDEY
jgi:hypothetical protein